MRLDCRPQFRFDYGTLWRWEILLGLCAWPRSLPPGKNGPLFSNAAPVSRARNSANCRNIWAFVQKDYSCRRFDLGWLGARPNDSRSKTRFNGSCRREIWPQSNHYHKSASRREMVWCDRRSNLCRCNPWSPCSSISSCPAGWPIHA